MPTNVFTQPLVQQMATFLRDIGLAVESRTIEEKTFLPGVALDSGRLVIDEAKLLYPGDILHEAGHLAITPAADRHLCGGNLAVSGGEEMAAICWSYAAALHVGIDPAIVFHEHGYKGGANSLLENYRNGFYMALPYLQWMGLALDKTKAAEQGCQPYPHMLRWLRA